MHSFRLDIELDGHVQSLTFSSPSVTIGRDPASDVFLDHPTVSRQHALIVQNSNGFTLVVVSQNGLTGVNGTQVVGQVELYDGTRLQIGQFLANFQTVQGGATIPFQPVRGAGPMAQGYPIDPGGSMSSGTTPPHMALQQGDAANPVVVGDMQGQLLHNAPTAAIPAVGGPPLPLQMTPLHAPQQAAAGPNTGAISNPGTSHGIMSWDDIAKQASNEDPNEKVETHYDRLKAASQKKQGTNPLVLLVVVIVAVTATYFYVSSSSESDSTKVVQDDTPKAEIVYLPNDFDCLKPLGCMNQAEEKYKLGIENLKKKQADVGNLFRGYMNLDMADRFVKASGQPRPEFMADLDAKRKEALTELKSIEQNYQVQYHRSQQRRQFDDMVSAIQAMRARFPDPRSRVYRDADAKEMFMKENAILPKKK